MLEPDYFYGKSDVLISYEQELEDWILQDIAMRLLKAEAMVLEQPIWNCISCGSWACIRMKL